MPKRKPTKAKPVPVLSRSRAANPCFTAWETFSNLKATLGATFTRKAAIEAACRAGVAFYTARTQYQQWKEAGDRDEKRNQTRLADLHLR